MELKLRQKLRGLLQFHRQVFLDDMVQAVLGESLLFDAHTHGSSFFNPKNSPTELELVPVL